MGSSYISNYLEMLKDRTAGVSTGQNDVLGRPSRNTYEPATATQKASNILPRQPSVTASTSPETLAVSQEEDELSANAKLMGERQAYQRSENQRATLQRKVDERVALQETQQAIMPQQTGIQIPIPKADNSISEIAGKTKTGLKAAEFGLNKASQYLVAKNRAEEAAKAAMETTKKANKVIEIANAIDESDIKSMSDYKEAKEVFNEATALSSEAQESVDAAKAAGSEVEILQQSAEKSLIADYLGLAGKSVGTGAQVLGTGVDIYNWTQGNTPKTGMDYINAGKNLYQTGKSIYDLGNAIGSTLAGSAAEGVAYTGMGSLAYGTAAETGYTGMGSLAYGTAADTVGVPVGQTVGQLATTGGAETAGLATSSLASTIGSAATVVGLASAAVGLGGMAVEALGGPEVVSYTMKNNLEGPGAWLDYYSQKNDPDQKDYRDIAFHPSEANKYQIANRIFNPTFTGQQIFKNLGRDMGELFGTVICTRLHLQKRIPADIYKADGRFGQKMDKDEYEWYLSWGKKVAQIMAFSQMFSSIVAFFFVPISHYMAGEMGVGKGSKIGKFYFKTLQFVFRRIK